ncbi:FAD-dependent oxidoreductase [Pseudomonas sp. BF-R-01]|uniref:FAD-dependent oxidoreductase n=1 Tax=Pseudomonas sp. BF-R-01 TaxID=2832365 RepID=UPI001CC13D89|nr:FAD-dependent oxidoreductase [Pseudomonas sp. BF-R-01]
MAIDFDVIVVGGGGAGLAAACHARLAGASVMVIEADSKLGGATALAGGVVYAAGTSVQREAGIEDSPEAMYQYMMSLNQWSIRPALAKILADSGASIIDWLIELGNEFPPNLIVESGVGGCPRGHQSIGAGVGIIQSLVNAAGALGVETALGSRVSDLIFEEGRVCGVRSEGVELRSKAVVVTTGGFGNNPEMIKRLWPTAAAHGSRIFSIYAAVPYNMGDGIALGEKVGAQLTGIDNGLLVPSPNFAPNLEAFLPEWAMVVNRDGHRFIPEDASYAVSGYLLNEQPERRCFAIFDEPAMLEACADENVVKHYINDPGSDSWRIAAIRKNVETGRVKVADSIEELARRADISPAGLAASIARYNRYADQGEDPEFFKKAKKIYPIRTGPFFAVEIRASAIVSCHAGLDIDDHGRVRDRFGEPIHGLYAGGEVLGCTLGRRYIGGGIGIANALTFGRLAGKTAALDGMAS